MSHRPLPVLLPLTAPAVLDKLVRKDLTIVVRQPRQLPTNAQLLAMGVEYTLDDGSQILGPLCLTYGRCQGIGNQSNTEFYCDHTKAVSPPLSSASKMILLRCPRRKQSSGRGKEC